VAADLVERGALEQLREERYAGWSGPLGRAILTGGEPLEVIAGRVAAGEIDPRPVSGEQERLENLVNQAIWSTDAARVEAGTRT
jgi:xylose isomerase